MRDALRPAKGIDGVASGAEIPVRTVAYGEGCPLDRRPGRRPRNRRVDVFVLDRGVSLAPPAGCHARALQSTVWRLACGKAPARGFRAELRTLIRGLLAQLAGTSPRRSGCEDRR